MFDAQADVNLQPFFSYGFFKLEYDYLKAFLITYGLLERSLSGSSR